VLATGKAHCYKRNRCRYEQDCYEPESQSSFPFLPWSIFLTISA
jgi:hypothetical protein